ncbi:Potassium channel, voltage-dependent, beta subunit, partial [Globisporangium splendens]
MTITPGSGVGLHRQHRGYSVVLVQLITFMPIARQRCAPQGTNDLQPILKGNVSRGLYDGKLHSSGFSAPLFTDCRRAAQTTGIAIVAPHCVRDGRTFVLDLVCWQPRQAIKSTVCCPLYGAYEPWASPDVGDIFSFLSLSFKSNSSCSLSHFPIWSSTNSSIHRCNTRSASLTVLHHDHSSSCKARHEVPLPRELGSARSQRGWSLRRWQPQYHIFERSRVEFDYVNLYKKYKLGLTTWSPLAFGILTGKYSKGTPEGARLETAWVAAMMPDMDARVAKTDKLKVIADELGCSLAQLAIAWCATNQDVSTVMLGATSIRQLEENLKANAFIDKITPEIKARIDEIAQFVPSFLGFDQLSMMCSRHL